MRRKDGGLDAQGPDPDDYYSIDFTEFDSAMEGSLKHLDLSFSVSDESDDDHDAETAAAWVRYPRLMLKSLEFRLNEILKICEARKFPNTVIQLQSEYIFTDEEKEYPVRSGRKLIFLLGISFVLRHCGKLVDTVNSIKATPFSGDVLTELVKCIGRGDTPEFDRSIGGYKGALEHLPIGSEQKRFTMARCRVTLQSLRLASGHSSTKLWLAICESKRLTSIQWLVRLRLSMSWTINHPLKPISWSPRKKSP